MTSSAVPAIPLEHNLIEQRKERENFFTRTTFVFGFSLVMALLWTLSFYPGILYSDSIPRWHLAIEVANNGFSHLSYFGSHHPVVPSILQAPFYFLTQEVGFYIFCQAATFCLSLFYFVRTFTKSTFSHIAIALVLLTPINHIYAIFHSFDSIFAIAFISLAASLIRLKLSGGKVRYWALSLFFFFLCVSARINAILLIFPIALYTLPLLRPFAQRKIAIVTALSLWLITALIPVFTPAILQMKGGNSWAVGFAWEYANLASKSSNTKHQDFLIKIGSSPEKITNNICYNGIWCGNEHRELISKVQGSNTRSKEVFKNYFNIALNEPQLFFSEKIKYISSLMGISRPLENFEIAKWRSGGWGEEFAELDFHTTESKEKTIDKYFSFSKSHTYLFKPYLIFLALGIAIAATLALSSTPIHWHLAAAAALSILYYATFIPTSQNHELRYFFPSLLLGTGIFIVLISLLVQKYISTKQLLILTISGLFFTWVYSYINTYKNFQDKLSLVNNHNNIELTNELYVTYTSENTLLFRSRKCDIDEKERFFLHAKNKDRRGKVTNKNLDFYWKEHAVEQPLFQADCIAEVNLDKDLLISFRAGQFNANNTRRWEKSISQEQLTVKLPGKIQAIELSDGNWDNGISKRRTGFFVANTPQHRLLSSGDRLRFSESGERVITNIYINNEYINIDTSGDKLSPDDGAPNWILVAKPESP